VNYLDTADATDILECKYCKNPIQIKNRLIFKKSDLNKKREFF